MLSDDRQLCRPHMPIRHQARQRKPLSASIFQRMREVVVAAYEVRDRASFLEDAQPATNPLGSVRKTRQECLLHVL